MPDSGRVRSALNYSVRLVVEALGPELVKIPQQHALDELNAESFAENSQRLSVEGSAGVAVVFDGAAAVTHFPRGGTIADNGEDVVRLTFSEIEEDTSVHELEV